MSSASSHSRTQSDLPSLSHLPRTHLGPGRVQSERHLRPDSPDIMPSFPIEPDHSHEYGVRLVDLARNSHDDLREPHQVIAAPPHAASPLRPALSSRLLSSLSTAQPAAVALTRKGSVLHSRAKSLAAFVPKLNTNSSVTSNPDKAPSTPNKIFADFFHGESAPIRLGPPISPTKEKDESEFIMDYRSVFTERPALLRKRSTFGSQANTTTSTPKAAPPIPSSTPTTRSTSWFTRSKPAPAAHRHQPPSPPDDLATLNVTAALFPNGPADPLDPTAFNNLLLNATNLLQRMQSAYREKVDYINSIQPEQEAQKDEVEEAETRATHLKKQLEDMSRRAQEQEGVMKEMARELAEERMRCVEFREAAESSIRLVGVQADEARQYVGRGGAEGGRTRRRGSVSNASDSGFESDMESIFSSYSGPPGTPLSPPPGISRMASCESRLNNATMSNNTNNYEGSNIHSTMAPQQPSKTTGTNGVPQRLGREGAAWATVDALRSENKELKRHLQEMHDELQGCIEFVSGVTGG